MRQAMSEWISTKEAMQILGVGSTTVKRWADNDKLPFIRTAGGHRRFRRSAVELLIRQEGVIHESAAAYRWVRRLRSEDVATIEDDIGLLHEFLGNWFTVADFLGTVTTTIGSCWADGEYSIVDEHIASAKLGQSLVAVSRSFDVRRGAPTCLLATLTGERHTLGLALTQMCLRTANIDALWVGVDMPALELARHLRRAPDDQQIVALSASEWLTDTVSLARGFRDVSAACREHEIKLILGGGGSWPDIIDYGHRCNSFKGLEQILSKLDLPQIST